MDVHFVHSASEQRPSFSPRSTIHPSSSTVPYHRMEPRSGVECSDVRRLCTTSINSRHAIEHFSLARCYGKTTAAASLRHFIPAFMRLVHDAIAARSAIAGVSQASTSASAEARASVCHETEALTLVQYHIGRVSGRQCRACPPRAYMYCATTLDPGALSGSWCRALPAQGNLVWNSVGASGLTAFRLRSPAP